MIILNTLSRKRISKTLVSRIFIAFFSCILLVGTVSCGSSKPRVATTKKQAAKRSKTRVTKVKRSTKKPAVSSSNSTSLRDEKAAATPLVKDVVKNALSYKGTRYKYGGSTRKGMDCSGLIHVSFKEAGKNVPRTSASLYDASRPINFKKVQQGDLLFFATGKNKRKVNHVGLVVKITPSEISFVHASSSRGVMVSTMNEGYWLNAYLSAGRLK